VNLQNYRRLSWTVLAINLGVILWGAFVRATGSGAGCGDHWPLCNGVVVPHEPSIETMIELTHRLTSGVALLSVMALVFFGRKLFPAGSPVRFGAWGSLIFIVIEALLGAGLVLFEYVAGDTRPLRGAVVGLHLVNTLLLLGWLALTIFWVEGGRWLRLKGRKFWILLPTMAAFLVLGASGAIAALGDTLFPVESLKEGFVMDFSEGAHILLRLRVLHPVFAIGTALLVYLCTAAVATQKSSKKVQKWAMALAGIFTLQLGLGFLNLLLLAPVWLQLLHLLVADLSWLSLIFLGAEALQEEEES
jgi:heme A synthase